RALRTGVIAQAAVAAQGSPGLLIPGTPPPITPGAPRTPPPCRRGPPPPRRRPRHASGREHGGAGHACALQSRGSRHAAAPTRRVLARPQVSGGLLRRPTGTAVLLLGHRVPPLGARGSLAITPSRELCQG